MTCAACGADLTGKAWMVGIATLEGKTFCSLACAKVYVHRTGLVKRGP